MGRKRTLPQTKKAVGERIRVSRDTGGASAPLEMPKMPTWILKVKGAKRVWDELGPVLLSIGLLSSVDGDTFAIHCDNVAKLEAVTLKVTNIDNWVSTTPNGFEIQSALFSIRNQLQDRVMKGAREFGLTPLSRAGIKTVDAAPKQPDMFADLAQQDTGAVRDPFVPLATMH